MIFRILSFLFLLSIGLPFSFILLEAYTFGDQFHYHNFYNQLYGLSFNEVTEIAKSTVDSNEPLTWLVLWIGSNLGIHKSIWISFLNMTLTLGIYFLLLKHKAPWYIFFLIFTNFYFFVLLTSAERLKIAYILIAYAFLMTGYRRFFVLSLSPLAHLQSIIILFGFLGCTFRSVLSKFINNPKINIRFLIFLIFLILTPFFFLFRDGIFSKLIFYYYQSSISIDSFVKFSTLLFIGFFASRNKFRMLLSLSPVFVSFLIVGGDRVNMIAFTLILGILMFEQRLKNPFVIFLLLYCSYKSLGFINNIFVYGDGFHEL